MHRNPMKVRGKEEVRGPEARSQESEVRSQGPEFGSQGKSGKLKGEFGNFAGTGCPRPDAGGGG